MKSPLPLLALGAAFLLMKGKGGSGSGEAASKTNFHLVKEEGAVPFLRGPYIQVTSTFEDVDTDLLGSKVKPIADANPDVHFIVAGPEGIHRLQLQTHQGEEASTLPQYTILSIHKDAQTPLVEKILQEDMTSHEEGFTMLKDAISDGLEYLKAPFTPGA